MSWFGFGKKSAGSGGASASGASPAQSAQSDQELQMRLLAELEVELTADMYQR